MSVFVPMQNSSVRRQRRFPIDLSGTMAVCDANYIRILKLLPGFTLHACRTLALPLPGMDTDSRLGCTEFFARERAALVILDVTDCQRYTSTVSIRLLLQEFASPYYRPPVMQVRLYHDASTAEVVSYQEQGSFHLRSQPGKGPEFTPDEKQQVNIFLAEWLTLCMEHGLGTRRLSAQDPDAEHLVPTV